MKKTKMKQIIILLFAMLLGSVAFAQQKVNTYDMGTDVSTYISPVLTSGDTLTANQDTIDFKIKYRSSGYVNKIAVHLGVDIIAGADTVTVEVLGYEFEDDATAATIIAASTTNLTGGTNIILSDDYSAAADEFSFRYYTVRVIRTGTGGGVLCEELELKLYN